MLDAPPSPLWTYLLTPIVTGTVATISVSLVLWQIRISRRSLSSNTILTLEQQFWANYQDTYTRIEDGSYENVSLAELAGNPSAFTEFERYLNYFNTLGILVGLNALSTNVVLEVYPYRIYRVLELQLTKELLAHNPVAWEGIARFEHLFQKKPSKYIRQLKLITAQKHIPKRTH